MTASAGGAEHYNQHGRAPFETCAHSNRSQTRLCQVEKNKKSPLNAFRPSGLISRGRALYSSIVVEIPESATDNCYAICELS
jgi:hypothetical protein